MQRVSANRILQIIGFIPVIVWSVLYLQADLWYDEVYTLEQFVLTDLKTTVTHYPAPNNHIFYNLLLQIITRLSGLRDSISIANYIFFIRAFHLIIVLVTAYFASLIVSMSIKTNYKNWIYIILFTTIPFLNFSLQLRGYALSAMLLTALIYYCIKQQNGYKSAVQIILLTFLSLYTIPSNLYIIASIWIGVFLIGILTNKSNLNYKKNLLFLAAGVILAIICYYPILDAVINNKFSSHKAPGTFYIVNIAIGVFKGFISHRYPFIIPAIIGGVIFLIKKKNPSFIFLNLALWLPFAFAFVHQKAVFERTFIPLIPVFTILVTISLLFIIEKFIPQKNKTVIIFIVSVVWIGISIKEIFKNYESVSKIIVNTAEPIQNSYQNFYLSSIYKQEKVFKELVEKYSGEPVFLYKIKDKYSTKLYLKKNNIPFQNIDSLSQITDFSQNSKRFYIITFNLNQTLKEFKTIPAYEVKSMLKKQFFSNVLVCTKD